ncbi:hypothetical protein JCM19294_1037 [Nonlabens tegetincola]|uniref:Uncharacterized protein n=1 Tax=Nonlabens tegetincola TaxID=323273 RepID=A0A090Q4P5_9FLAO|nr:hypothetical protein JCM19294_1037 [Nonlabens tegetincola]
MTIHAFAKANQPHERNSLKLAISHGKSYSINCLYFNL